MCTHYGAKHFDAELHRGRAVRPCLSSGGNNLHIYMAMTNRLGKRPGAIKDIMSVYRDVTRMEYVCKDGVETLDSVTPQPLMERCAPAPIAHAAIEAVEGVVDSETMIVESAYKGRVESWASITQPAKQGEPAAISNTAIEATHRVDVNARSMSDYQEAFECNTTRSCCLEFGEYGIGYYSDEDCEEDVWCSDQGEEYTMHAPGEAMQQGALTGCPDVSEEESVNTPGVMRYEECC